MELQQFWQLIEQARKKSDGDVDEQAELLAEKLSALPVEEIIEFDRWFQQLMCESYQSQLWAAAYVILGGCSDDGFEYFRAWLIAKGPKVYEAALADPDTLAKVVKLDEPEESEAESMLYVAASAYEQQTGQTDFADLALPTADYPAVDLYWSQREDLLAEMLPKLTRKFA